MATKHQYRFSISADAPAAEIPIPDAWRNNPNVKIMMIFDVPTNNVHLVESATETEGIPLDSGASGPIPFGPLHAGRYPRFAYAASTTTLSGVIRRTD